MSEKASLLLDIGNSFAKAVWLRDGQLSSPFSLSLDERLNDIPINDVDKLWVANVNDRTISQRLSTLTDTKCEFEEVFTSPNAFGLQCAYSNFNHLGVDRWLAILAIHQHETLPYAVIDAGTALTCDFVSGNQHLGGWIAPGFDMMRSALQKGTKHVFTDSVYPTQALLGKDTPECVNFGCMAYMRGCVHEARTHLESINDEYRIYVTGGNQTLLSFPDDRHIIFEQNLVFKGLQRFAERAII